jgi:hypothetical protein
MVGPPTHCARPVHGRLLQVHGAPLRPFGGRRPRLQPRMVHGQRS